MRGSSFQSAVRLFSFVKPPCFHLTSQSVVCNGKREQRLKHNTRHVLQALERLLSSAVLSFPSASPPSPFIKKKMPGLLSANPLPSCRFISVRRLLAPGPAHRSTFPPLHNCCPLPLFFLFIGSSFACCLGSDRDDFFSSLLFFFVFLLSNCLITPPPSLSSPRDHLVGIF